jgi:hypothetical protein
LYWTLDSDFLVSTLYNTGDSQLSVEMKTPMATLNSGVT